ncbi:MAG: SusC/RagA family TonB-linked outer membrane protein [Bacteroidales bacterium]
MRKITFILVIMCFTLLSSSVYAQESVTGKVTDESGVGIPGAAVIQKDTGTGTITDVDGKYSVSVPADAVLQISFMGMLTQEVSVSGKSVVDVTLKEDVQGLKEVIVVGYGVQKKENLTGAVATIDVAETFESRPVTDVAKALQGATPGVIVRTSTGALDQASSIQIRGGSSLNGGAPLILVDNVETTNLNMLNPDDIESMSVLKDAASASIYGARAAYGVVLITTKQGKKSQKTRVSYTGNLAFSEPLNMPTIAKTYQAAAAGLMAQERINGATSLSIINTNVNWDAVEKMIEWEKKYGGQDLGSEMVYGRDWETIGGKDYYYRSWDAIDMYLRSSTPSYYNNINLSGGTDFITYSVSLGQTSREGLYKIKNDKYKRYNATANVSMKLSNFITARFRSMLSRSKYEEPFDFNGGTFPNWYYITRWNRWIPYGTIDGIGYRNTITNDEQANYNTSKSQLVRTGLGTTLDFAAVGVKGLKFDLDYTFNSRDNHDHSAGGWAYGYDIFSGNAIDNYRNYTGDTYNYVGYYSSWYEQNTWKGFFTYDKTFKEKHNFKVIAGLDYENYEYWRHGTVYYDMLDMNKPEINLTVGEANKSASPSDRSRWTTMGLFWRLNYDYMGKYLFEINGRYDGSSRFPVSSQYAYFPSASIGYRISEENFWKPIKPYVSNFKLRSSWGMIGNQSVGTNTFVSTVSTGTSGWIINGENVYSASNPTVVSDELSWEKVTTSGFGVDAGLLDNKLNFVFDWYQRVTSDMIRPGESLAPTYGASGTKINFGELKTTGWEIGVNFTHEFKNKLRLNLSASLFDYKTIITKYDATATGLRSYHEGMELGEIWGLEVDRLFQESDFDETGKQINGADQSSIASDWFTFGPGDVMYKDINGDGKISTGSWDISDVEKGTSDVTKIGNETPKYQYSFTIGAEWQGFDVNMFFQGVGKREYWATGVYAIPGARHDEVWYEHQLDFWTVDNTDAFWPRPTDYADIAKWNFVINDRYLQDMSYLRLKNLTLGYTIPNYLTSKIGLSKVRVYFSGENLITWDNTHIPMDPETALIGTRASNYGKSYPFSRTYSGGIQLNF